MKLRYITSLLLVLVFAGTHTGLGAQGIVMCESFEGYNVGSVPPGWNYDAGETYAPVVYTGGHMSARSLRLSLLNRGHGVTMQLPQGLSLQGCTLMFDVRPFFLPDAYLIVGSMVDDTTYSSFRPLDTINIPENSQQQWMHCEISLAGLSSSHSVIAYRLDDHSSQSITRQVVIDDVVISSFYVYDFHVVDVTATSVTLDWQQSDPLINPWLFVSDGYDVVDSFMCATHPVTLDSLLRGVSYFFYLKPDTSSAAVACQQFFDSAIVYIPVDRDGCIAYDNLYADGVTTFCGTFDTPYSDTLFVNYGPDNKYSRQTIHYDTLETDPLTGNQLRTVRPGALSSVRLGNWDVNRQAESVMYTITVDTNNFDLIILNYAAVLENPNHMASQQPHFRFELLDENYNQIDPSCGAADFVSSINLGWNSYNGILWKDWTTVAFSVGAYHGRTIYVRLTTYDCRAGAHYGYAYFDLGCAHSIIRVSSCQGSAEVTLSAPDGFTYRWFRQSAPTTVISTQQSITVPIDGSLYLCQATFIDRPDCSFTISGYAVAAHNVAAIDTTVTFDSCTMYVAFHNASTRIDGVGGVYDTTPYTDNARWNFGNGLTSSATDTVIAYTQPGTYNVTLTSLFVDCEDVDSVKVVVPVPASTHRDTVVSACDSLHWRGVALYGLPDSSRHLELTDTFHFPNPYGCDSTLTLYLDLHPSYIMHDTALFCFGDSLSYAGTAYEADTVLPLPYTSIHGCDSTHLLLLTHRPPLPPPAMTISNDADTFAVGHPVVGCAEMLLNAVDTSHVSAWRWTANSPNSAPDSPQTIPTAQWSLSTGCWALALVRTDTVGCTDSLHLDSVAIVMPSPHAAFTIEPKRIPIFGDKTMALNASEPDTCTWLWYNANDSATSRDWSYRWPEVSAASDELVTLVATIRHSVVLGDSLVTLFCTDTAVDTVHILIPWLDFPSLVTPNGDGINDIWGIVGLLDEGWFPQNELWIFNQWGVLVYHVRDISSPDQFWDPNERPCPDGAYFYRFAARSQYGIVKRNGVIEVLRE